MLCYFVFYPNMLENTMQFLAGLSTPSVVKFKLALASIQEQYNTSSTTEHTLQNEYLYFGWSMLFLRHVMILRCQPFDLLRQLNLINYDQKSALFRVIFYVVPCLKKVIKKCN